VFDHAECRAAAAAAAALGDSSAACLPTATVRPQGECLWQSTTFIHNGYQTEMTNDTVFSEDVLYEFEHF
jgi:hypothetical protein